MLVRKAVTALIMETGIGSPIPAWGQAPCLQEGLLQAQDSPLNQAPLSSWGAGLAPSTPLSCMQICHLISLLYLCAKPVSIPLQT